MNEDYDSEDINSQENFATADQAVQTGKLILRLILDR